MDFSILKFKIESFLKDTNIELSDTDFRILKKYKRFVKYYG